MDRPGEPGIGSHPGAVMNYGTSGAVRRRVMIASSRPPLTTQQVSFGLRFWRNLKMHHHPSLPFRCKVRSLRRCWRTWASSG